MNLLAHVLLAWHTLGNTSGQECTGAVMADSFGGQKLADYPIGIRMGIRQHRDIDAFTDRHPGFARCRRLIAEAGAPRFTAGILTDIFWDHVLASDWKTWGEPLCGLDLEPFCDNVYSLLWLTKDCQSPGFASAAKWIAGRRWLSSYASLDGIERTLRGLSGRMSGHPDLAASAPILVSEDRLIRSTFAAFWPELVDFARDWAGRETAVGAHVGSTLKDGPSPLG